MTLQEMGEQYAREADRLEAMITACKERQRFAMQGGNSAEAHRQERLMELHSQQRGDLLRLSVWLRHYYDGTGHDDTEGGACDADHQSNIA